MFETFGAGLEIENAAILSPEASALEDLGESLAPLNILPRRGMEAYTWPSEQPAAVGKPPADAPVVEAEDTIASVAPSANSIEGSPEDFDTNVADNGAPPSFTKPPKKVQPMTTSMEKGAKKAHKQKAGDALTPEQQAAGTAELASKKEIKTKRIIQKQRALAQKAFFAEAPKELRAKDEDKVRGNDAVQCKVPPLVGKHQIAILGHNEPGAVTVAEHGLASVPVDVNLEVTLSCAKGFTPSTVLPSSACSLIDGKFHPPIDSSKVQCFATPFCTGISKPELRCFEDAPASAPKLGEHSIKLQCVSPKQPSKAMLMERFESVSATSQAKGSRCAEYTLGGSGAWCFENNRDDSLFHIMQIDLGRRATVEGIVTQGMDSRVSWVEAYSVSFSLDGHTWKESTEECEGNSDDAGRAESVLEHNVEARFVRIHLLRWTGMPALRVGVLVLAEAGDEVEADAKVRAKEISEKTRSRATSSEMKMKVAVARGSDGIANASSSLTALPGTNSSYESVELGESASVTSDSPAYSLVVPAGDPFKPYGVVVGANGWGDVFVSGQVRMGKGEYASGVFRFSPQGLLADALITNDEKKGSQSEERKRLYGSKLIVGHQKSGSNLNQLHHPRGMAFDENGDLYVADAFNHRIIRYVKFRVIETQMMDHIGAHNGEVVAGKSGVKGSSLLALNTPESIAFDSKGSMYVCDMGNHRVMRWTKDRIASADTKLHGLNAGEVIAGISGYNTLKLQLVETPGITQVEIFASLHSPQAITVDRKGDLYVADTKNHRVLRYKSNMLDTKSWPDMNGVMGGKRLPEVVAGESDLKRSKPGRSYSQLNKPSSLVFDADGNLFVGDTGNDRVLKWSNGELVDAEYESSAMRFKRLSAPQRTDPVSGKAWNSFVGKYPGKPVVPNAQLLGSQEYAPTGIAFNSVGDLFVASYDGGNKYTDDFNEKAGETARSSGQEPDGRPRNMLFQFPRMAPPSMCRITVPEPKAHVLIDMTTGKHLEEGQSVKLGDKVKLVCGTGRVASADWHKQNGLYTCGGLKDGNPATNYLTATFQPRIDSSPCKFCQVQCAMPPSENLPLKSGMVWANGTAPKREERNIGIGRCKTDVTSARERCNREPMVETDDGVMYCGCKTAYVQLAVKRENVDKCMEEEPIAQDQDEGERQFMTRWVKACTPDNNSTSDQFLYDIMHAPPHGSAHTLSTGFISSKDGHVRPRIRSQELNPAATGLSFDSFEVPAAKSYGKKDCHASRIGLVGWCDRWAAWQKVIPFYRRGKLRCGCSSPYKYVARSLSESTTPQCLLDFQPTTMPEADPNIDELNYAGRVQEWKDTCLKRPNGVVKIGDVITIKGPKFKRFCSDSGKTIKCNREWAKEWETFKVVQVPGYKTRKVVKGAVALQGGMTKRVCGADDGVLECSGFAKNSEFMLIDSGKRGGDGSSPEDSKFYLKVNGKFCTDDGFTITCRKDAPGDDELFEISCKAGCFSLPTANATNANVTASDQFGPPRPKRRGSRKKAKAWPTHAPTPPPTVPVYEGPPTAAPTLIPTSVPTLSPTNTPTSVPTSVPTPDLMRRLQHKYAGKAVTTHGSLESLIADCLTLKGAETTAKFWGGMDFKMVDQVKEGCANAKKYRTQAVWLMDMKNHKQMMSFFKIMDRNLQANVLHYMPQEVKDGVIDDIPEPDKQLLITVIKDKYPPLDKKKQGGQPAGDVIIQKINKRYCPNCPKNSQQPDKYYPMSKYEREKLLKIEIVKELKQKRMRPKEVIEDDTMHNMTTTDQYSTKSKTIDSMKSMGKLVEELAAKRDRKEVKLINEQKSTDPKIDEKFDGPHVSKYAMQAFHVFNNRPLNSWDNAAESRVPGTGIPGKDRGDTFPIVGVRPEGMKQQQGKTMWRGYKEGEQAPNDYPRSELGELKTRGSSDVDLMPGKFGVPDEKAIWAQMSHLLPGETALVSEEESDDQRSTDEVVTNLDAGYEAPDEPLPNVYVPPNVTRHEWQKLKHPYICAEDHGKCHCDGMIVYGRKSEEVQRGTGSKFYDGHLLDNVMSYKEFAKKNTMRILSVEQSQMVQGVQCSADVMGGDPAPGEQKQCYCADIDPGMDPRNFLPLNMPLVNATCATEPPSAPDGFAWAPILDRATKARAVITRLNETKPAKTDLDNYKEADKWPKRRCFMTEDRFCAATFWYGIAACYRGEGRYHGEGTGSKATKLGFGCPNGKRVMVQIQGELSTTHKPTDRARWAAECLPMFTKWDKKMRAEVALAVDYGVASTGDPYDAPYDVPFPFSSLINPSAYVTLNQSSGISKYQAPQGQAKRMFDKYNDEIFLASKQRSAVPSGMELLAPSYPIQARTDKCTVEVQIRTAACTAEPSVYVPLRIAHGQPSQATVLGCGCGNQLVDTEVHAAVLYMVDRKKETEATCASLQVSLVNEVKLLLAGVPDIDKLLEASKLKLLSAIDIKYVDFVYDNHIRQLGKSMMKACSLQRTATTRAAATDILRSQREEVHRQAERKNKRFEKWLTIQRASGDKKHQSAVKMEKDAKKEGWTKERTQKSVAAKTELLKKKTAWEDEKAQKKKLTVTGIKSKIESTKEKEAEQKRVEANNAGIESNAKATVKQEKMTMAAKLKTEAADEKKKLAKMGDAEAKEQVKNDEKIKDSEKELAKDMESAAMKEGSDAENDKRAAESASKNSQNKLLKEERALTHAQKDEKTSLLKVQAAEAKVVNYENREGQEDEANQKKFKSNEDAKKTKAEAKANERGEKQDKRGATKEITRKTTRVKERATRDGERQKQMDAQVSQKEKFNKWEAQDEATSAFEQKQAVQQEATQLAVDRRASALIQKKNRLLKIQNQQLIDKLDLDGALEAAKSMKATEAEIPDGMVYRYPAGLVSEHAAKEIPKPTQKPTTEKVIRKFLDKFEREQEKTETVRLAESMDEKLDKQVEAFTPLEQLANNDDIVPTAHQPTKLALQRVQHAHEVRQKARETLLKMGKPIPSALRRGSLVQDLAVKAMQKKASITENQHSVDQIVKTYSNKLLDGLDHLDGAVNGNA